MANFVTRFLLPVPIRTLLRLLTLLLGIFYLDTVCQTDTEDARAYYARGIAEYVAPPASVTVTAPVVRPAVRTIRSYQLISSQLAARWWQRQATRPTPYPLPPPALLRRWLRYGVQQV